MDRPWWVGFNARKAGVQIQPAPHRAGKEHNPSGRQVMNHLNFATPEDALKGKKLYEEVIRDTEKRIWAEVLAACIHEMKTGRTRVNFVCASI